MSNRIVLSLLSFVLFTSACSTRGVGTYHSSAESSSHRYEASITKKADTKSYSHPTMKPYTIQGITYYPKAVNVGDVFKGNASWYGPDFHGKLTSNGETYNMHEMTAAHKTLPMNTVVRVTNLRNGLTAVVRINDRGPFVATRIIDLSNKAAKQIKMIGSGTAPVKLEVLGFQSKTVKPKVTKKLKKQKKVVKKEKKHEGLYALQIASFSKIDGALATQEKYDNIDGYETVIQDIESSNGRMFKVILKGFESEEEVRDYKAKSKLFNKAFITRVKED